MKIAIGSDHAGLELKNFIKEALESDGYGIEDVGTHTEESCDYPDFAREVGRLVAEGGAQRGILICGTGLGMAIAANKMRGIRAAHCHEPVSARLTRLDNDSNVLTMGGRIIGPVMALETARAWLETEFAGGRHARRVDKITALED